MDKVNKNNKWNLWRKNRIAQGLCCSCGQVNDRKGKCYCTECAKDVKKRHKNFRVKLKQEIFDAYGSNCSCCGESELMFLEIHHIHGNGNQHRKLIGYGDSFYAWLRKNNFPKEFEVLCSNCNTGIFRNNGICPHKAEKTNATP